MDFVKFLVLLLVTSFLSGVRCHHHHHHTIHGENKNGKDQIAPGHELLEEDANRRSLNEAKGGTVLPFSERRLEKMLEKAILKIITGDLSTADMLLLKSLNYSLDEVLAIRKRELNRRKDEELKKEENLKFWTKILYGGDSTKTRNGEEKSPMEIDDSSVVTTDPAAKKDHRKKSSYKDFDFDEYNRQAVIDYENVASKMELQQSWSDPTVLDYEETAKEENLEEKGSVESLHRNFDKAMEPHVVFKIRYDDSDIDSGSSSEEKSAKNRGTARTKSTKHRVPSNSRHTTSGNSGNSFHAFSSSSVAATPRASLPAVYRLNGFNKIETNGSKSQSSTTILPIIGTSSSSTVESSMDREKTDGVLRKNSSEEDSTKNVKINENGKKVSEYEGLEWVEDDVYRVIPAFAESLGYENNNEDNDTSDYEDNSNYYRENWNAEENENDTLEYQNDPPESVKLILANNVTSSNFTLANLSAYQQVVLAHRREGNLTASFGSQGQKAIEDIKSRVLALTGRFNLSSNANQVQRERLTMFSPTCQMPRNTDSDAWTDPFAMNMLFQLNLTSGEHVVAAKLRIFKLPQENLTSSVSGTLEEEEEDEKKIRISIYYYTKSLKKHRSKKRLMDSVVTPLTPEGTHLALDVRQGLRFWRLNPRNSHQNGNNHGLVIQVEDQDGRPLKPSLYIEEPSCAELDSDQKAYQRLPALFIRACTRYVRIVNGETVTYVNCRH